MDEILLRLDSLRSDEDPLSSSNFLDYRVFL